MKFKNTKWSLGGISGRMIKTNEYGGFVADVDTLENAKLIVHAPDMYHEIRESITDLLCIQANVLDACKTDNKWEGVYEILQKQIDRKKDIIKRTTTI